MTLITQDATFKRIPKNLPLQPVVKLLCTFDAFETTGELELT